MAEKTKVAPWITPGAEYKTRNGQKVRVYAVDGDGCYPVHGALQQATGWRVRSWTAAGTVSPSGLKNGATS